MKKAFPIQAGTIRQNKEISQDKTEIVRLDRGWDNFLSQLGGGDSFYGVECTARVHITEF